MRCTGCPCTKTNGGHADGGWRHKIGCPSRNSDEEEKFMKLTVASLLVLTSLILTFAFVMSAPGAPHKAHAPEASARSATTTPTPAERHPQIREAIAALRRAKEHMEHAAHDYDGHRVEAIRATDEAIRQLELCLKFDKD